jgi:hypothetical protein
MLQDRDGYAQRRGREIASGVAHGARSDTLLPPSDRVTITQVVLRRFARVQNFRRLWFGL